MPRVLALVLLAVLSVSAPAATRVLASNNPLAMVAAAVALPDTEVQTLLPQGVSIHDFSLSLPDEQAVRAADVVVWTGPEAEPWLAAVLATPREGQQVITLSKLPGVVLRDYRLDAADGKKRPTSPYLWLSTRNAALLARALGARLGNTRGADHFAAEVQRFRNRQLARFAPIAALPAIAANDAYGYLFDEIGLTNVSAVVAATPKAIPTERRMRDLQARVTAERITCLIGEPGFETGAAPSLFPDGHVSLVVLDPMLPGIPLSRDAYTQALVQFADTLYGCLVTR